MKMVMKYSKTWCITRSFTLVELLVVISVIAILASMLLPALQKARTKTFAINCANNIKQISLISNYYMDDNEGYLPKNVTATGAKYWADMLYATHIGKEPGCKIIFRTEDWSTTDAETPREPFDCPSSIPDSANNERLSIDYTINIHMTATYGRANCTKRPSLRGVIMDGYRKVTTPDQGTSPAATVDYNALMLTENYKAWRHSKGVNVGFFDGHVSSSRYGSIPDKTGDPEIYPDRYFWGEGYHNNQPGRAP